MGKSLDEATEEEIKQDMMERVSENPLAYQVRPNRVEACPRHTTWDANSSLLQGNKLEFALSEAEKKKLLKEDS